MKSEAKLISRLMLGISVLGLCALIFVGGAGIVFFRLSGSGPLVQGFEAARAWYHRLREIGAEERVIGREDDASLLRQAKVHYDKENVFSGYTLISMRSSTNVYLIDMQGHVVHTWHIPYDKVWPTPPPHIHPLAKAKIFVERAELMPNGDLIATYTGTGDTPYGYGLVKVDKDSNIIWKFPANTHHSFYLNRHTGEILALTHKFMEKPEHGDEDFNYPILADYITRLAPDGKVLDQISVFDAFQNSPYASLLHFLTSQEAAVAWNREGWDLLHTNSVVEMQPDMANHFPMFKPGQILISLRRTSALAVIDPVSRKVVWAKQGSWKGQHAAQFVADGHILLLDNLGYATKDQHFSRVLEIDPVTGDTVWSFTGSLQQPFYSQIFGFLQRLPNGDTFVAESNNARLLEINSAGSVVWSYQQSNAIGENGNENAILAAPRYTPDEVPFLTSRTQ